MGDTPPIALVRAMRRELRQALLGQLGLCLGHGLMLGAFTGALWVMLYFAYANVLRNEAESWRQAGWTPMETAFGLAAILLGITAIVGVVVASGVPSEYRALPLGRGSLRARVSEPVADADAAMDAVDPLLNVMVAGSKANMTSLRHGEQNTDSQMRGCFLGYFGFICRRLLDESSWVLRLLVADSREVAAFALFTARNRRAVPLDAYSLHSRRPWRPLGAMLLIPGFHVLGTQPWRVGITDERRAQVLELAGQS